MSRNTLARARRGLSYDMRKAGYHVVAEDDCRKGPPVHQIWAKGNLRVDFNFYPATRDLLLAWSGVTHSRDRFAGWLKNRETEITGDQWQKFYFQHDRDGDVRIYNRFFCIPDSTAESNAA